MPPAKKVTPPTEVAEAPAVETTPPQHFDASVWWGRFVRYYEVMSANHQDRLGGTNFLALVKNAWSDGTNVRLELTVFTGKEPGFFLVKEVMSKEARSGLLPYYEEIPGR